MIRDVLLTLCFTCDCLSTRRHIPVEWPQWAESLLTGQEIAAPRSLAAQCRGQDSSGRVVDKMACSAFMWSEREAVFLIGGLLKQK